jgi:putative endonuclease
MFSTYILWSESLQRFYIGQTDDLDARLAYHNAGHVKSTRAGRPWQRVYHETFDTRSEAVRRERQIKNWKSAQSIRDMIARAQS